MLHGIPDDAPEWLDEATWVAMVHPDDREATVSGIDAAISAGLPWRIQRIVDAGP